MFGVYIVETSPFIIFSEYEFAPIAIRQPIIKSEARVLKDIAVVIVDYWKIILKDNSKSIFYIPIRSE